MKILCLLSHPRADILLQALSGLEGADVRTANSWSSFMEAVVEEGPSIAFLGFRALLRDGEEALASAPWALQALGIPSVVAFADQDELSACDGQLSGFDGICLLSEDADEIARVCADAMTAHAARTEVPAALHSGGASPALTPHAAVADDVTPFDPEDAGFQEDLYGDSSDASGHFDAVPSAAGERAPETGERERLAELDSHVSELLAGSVLRSTPTSGTALALEGVLQVQIELPPLDAGEVTPLVFARLLLGIGLAQRSGELVLRNGSVERRFVVSGGEIGRLDQPVSTADEAKLFSVITWNSGHYEFVSGPVSRPRFYGFGSAASVVLRSVQRHASLNEIASSLVRHFSSYPVAATSSDSLALLREASPEVARFLDAATGSVTLEQMLARAAGNVDATMQYAQICWSLGGIVFLPEPASQPVAVVLRRPKAAGGFAVSDDGVAGSEAIGSASSSSIAVLNQLEELQARFGKSDPYAAFGLAPGCGLASVERRYYELVREFHPDRFGRSNHASVRAEADALFVRLRDLQGILGGLERSRPGSEPGQSAGFAVSGTNPSLPLVGPATTVTRPTVPRPAESRISSAQEALEQARRSGGSSPTQSGVHARVGALPSAAVSAVRTGPAPLVSSNPSMARTVVTPAVPSAAVSQATPRPAQPAVGRASGDQLFRNAQKVLETGAVDKAWDMLVAARQKGASGPLVDAHEAYLLVMRKKLDGRTAKKQMEKALEDLVEPHLRSSAAVLLGHLARAEENYTEALSCYRQATDIDGNNQEANRWVRHLRQQFDKAKKPVSFLDRLLTPKKPG